MMSDDEQDVDEPEMVNGEPVTTDDEGNDAGGGLGTLLLVGLLAAVAAALGSDDTDNRTRGV